MAVIICVHKACGVVGGNRKFGGMPHNFERITLYALVVLNVIPSEVQPETSEGITFVRCIYGCQGLAGSFKARARLSFVN